MLKKTDHLFVPNDKRVITKLFLPKDSRRIRKIYNRIEELPGAEKSRILAQVYGKYNHRHRDLKRKFKDNFDAVKAKLKLGGKFSLDDKLLVGAYFTMEYSVESAALFNPSIVFSPNQFNLKPNQKRVVITFRAVGEGHVSSIVFRQGVLDLKGKLDLVGGSTKVEEAMVISNQNYNKEDFIMRLREAGLHQSSKVILDELLDDFTLAELKEAIKKAGPRFNRRSDRDDLLETILWVVNSNYEIRFHPKTRLSERVIFPISENEKKGLEDARFVQFTEDGHSRYYATYTAYSGASILPQLLETDDFLTFRVHTLHGEGSQNKGMALFPEKVRGRYGVISRQDNENLYIMYSDNILHWEEPALLRRPRQTWEKIQIGNCGSPIKTDKGWLLLTHGVGPMREYCIGCLLLDLRNPGKVLGYLRDPLIVPDERERNGYVPNVVYSCGAILYGDYLHVPYAMSDTRSSVARIEIRELLSALTEAAPVSRRGKARARKNSAPSRKAPG